VIALTVMAAACAGSLRDNATLATNTAQSVLTAVDDVWAPLVQDEIAKARGMDDEGYKQHMAAFVVVNEAIEEARRATQLLNLAVQTWDAQADGGHMFTEIVPCVVQDLQLIRALLRGHEANAPPQLTQALNIIEISLIALSKPGATCVRKVKATTLSAVAVGAS